MANFTLKVLNNFARFDLRSLQKMLQRPFNSDQFYHISTFLFDFASILYDSNKEIKDMLTQLIILIGYFALGNFKNQNLLSRGTENQNIVYKLASLPYQFYFGKSENKDVLFPTLLSVCHENHRNLKILLSEINKVT